MNPRAVRRRARVWLRSVPQRYFRVLTAGATFLLGMAVTFNAWQSAKTAVEAQAQQDFDNRMAEMRDAIRGRMVDYAQVLRGGAGIFAAAPQLTREEWRTYVEGLRLDLSYPGIQGLGLLLRVPARDLAAHEQAVRADGFPAYAVRPPGARPEYIPVVYIEPRNERNLRAIGFDMFSEPVRRAAIQRARDTGEPAISGKVTLTQDAEVDAQPGFLMFLPIYGSGTPADRIEDRRQSANGFVYAPFRTRDLMRGVLGTVPHVRLEIFDGLMADPSNLLYDSAPALASDLRAPAYTRITQVIVQDRVWTLKTSSLPDFENAIDRSRPMTTLVAGEAIVVMLTALVWVLATLRARALALADRMTTQLRESRERLSLALEGSNLALFDWDLVSDTVTLSPRWNTLLGGKPAVTITTIQKLEALVHPEDLPRLRETLVRTLKGVDNFYHVEHRVKAFDGTWKWIASHAQVSERDDAGQALRITGTNADITERKAVEDMKNEFIGTVSHELRTPLSALVGSLALFREEYGREVPQQAAIFLDMAYQNSERLAALVNNILDLEKVESGRLELKLEAVELVPFLEHAIVLNAAYAEQFGTRFALDPDVARVTVTADPDRLMQVLTNLLSNAAKHNPAAGRAIDVRAHASKGRVRIEVADHGPGVPEAFRGRLFGKFAQAQTPDGKAKVGTGLGLAISKAIVEAMKGEIGYRPGDDGGAVFWFEVPLT